MQFLPVIASLCQENLHLINFSMMQATEHVVLFAEGKQTNLVTTICVLSGL